MNAFLYFVSNKRCRSPPVRSSFQIQLFLEMEDGTLTEREDKEDKKVRQFVLFCRTALKYEKLNYYNERKYRAERESHIDMLTAKQLGMAGRIFDTYHGDYFLGMGHEIGIVDGDLAQALRELPDGHRQIVLMYYIVGLNDREIGEILDMVRPTVCARRNSAMKKLRRMMEEMRYEW